MDLPENVARINFPQISQFGETKICSLEIKTVPLRVIFIKNSLLNFTKMPIFNQELVSLRIGEPLPINVSDKFQKKFMKNKSVNTIIIVFLITLFAGCGVMTTTEISVIHNEIIISGRYGERINVEDVDRIKLQEQMPRILLRTNGTAFGEIRRGYFRLENIGRAKLFLESRSAPFILIEKNNGEKIFLNRSNREQTENYYQKLREWLNSRN
jgi:hypothetical protein